MQTIFNKHLADYLPHILIAILILVAGLVVAHVVRRSMKHTIKIKDNDILVNFLATLVFILVIIITLIMAMGQLGLPTATLITILGAGSLAIGLALKDFLANIAAGFMIIFLKPFKVGDSIIVNNTTGSITTINLFMTQLKSLTNECIFIPNATVINNSITNQSYYPIRRMDLEIGVGYETDLKSAKSLIQSILENCEYVNRDHDPIIGVTDLGDSAIVFLVRFWIGTADYVVAKHQILETVKQRFAEASINLPYPQMDLHILKDKKI